MTAPGEASANATAQAERAALCDLLLQLGPDAPTCCEGWSSRDLAAHLVIRERRPDAAAGIVISRLRGWTAQVQDGIARQPWPRLVEQVRSGPPRWSPVAFGVLDGLINTTELFVHHEDVRRAQPAWQPRELSATTTAQLWDALTRSARVLARQSPVGIAVRPTDGPAPGEERSLKSGARVVTLVGPVGECLLALFGRPTEGLLVEGAPADAAAFRSFPR